MESNPRTEKVIIIGSGPAGLASALYTARATLKPLVISGSPSGGQLTFTSHVENYPGFDSILGPDLISKMRKHAEKFGARFMDQNVLKVDFLKRPFRVYIPNVGVDRNRPEKRANSNSPLQDNFISASSIIIATGAKALWLGLASETRLRGKGVSACATCDGFFFRDKIVAVIGGGDAAMEEALTLTHFAKKVYLIHRRDAFRASKIMQERVFANPKVEIIWNAQVMEVLGDKKVEGVKLKIIAPLLHGSIANKTVEQSNNETILSVDGLFIAIGHKPDTDLFKDQIELDEKGYIITSARRAFDIAKLLHGSIAEKAKKQLNNATMKQSNNFDFNFQYMTSIPGIFAAGDCVDFKYRQAATAVGMGVASAIDAEWWLGK